MHDRSRFRSALGRQLDSGFHPFEADKMSGNNKKSQLVVVDFVSNTVGQLTVCVALQEFTIGLVMNVSSDNW